MTTRTVLTRLLSVSTVVALGVGITAGCAPAADVSGAETVDTAFGEFVVPESVERVVVLEGRRDLDIALALELPLVGYPYEGPETGIEMTLPIDEELAAARDAGAEQLFLAGEVDIEAIAAAEPDLIISRIEDAEPILTELQAIAPVLPVSTEDLGVSWQEDLRLVASVTGTEDQAEELIAEYDVRTADIAETHADVIAETPVAPMGYDLEGSEVEWHRLGSVVLRDVGAVQSEAFAASEAEGAIEFSPEQTLEAYDDAAALLVFADTEEEWDAALVDPLFAQLPAVQGGAVVRGDKMLHQGGPITALHLADMIDDLYSKVR